MSADEPLRYKRNLSGTVVHRFACSTLQGNQGVEWTYAEGLDGSDIAALLLTCPWLSACRVCRPTEGQA